MFLHNGYVSVASGYQKSVLDLELESQMVVNLYAWVF